MLIPHLGVIDNIYAYLKNRTGRSPDSLFFSKGWGDRAAMAEVRERISCGARPAEIDVKWESGWTPYLGHFARDGYFDTPFFQKHLPAECRACFFRLILPQVQAACPVYLQMATSSEEGYRAREASLAIPLLKKGCGSLILEHPFLGRRRPSGQGSTRLSHVSDLLLQGGAAVEEARALLQWLRQRGYAHLGITGVSIGGHLAALAGALTAFEIAIVPCVAPHSAVPVFTEGLIKDACDWQTLAGGDADPRLARLRLREHLHFTGIEQFPRPGKNAVAIAVAALDDRFVPRHSTETFVSHWDDAEFRWIKGGHVSSILGQKNVFLSALFDAMSMLQRSVPSSKQANIGVHAIDGARAMHPALPQ